MINIIGKRFAFLRVSLAGIILCIVAVAIFGLKPGIELSSGTLLTVNFEQTVATEDLRQELYNLGYQGAIIQRTGEGSFIIRTTEMTGSAKSEMERALVSEFGSLTIPEFDTVSPMVARETVRNAGIAIGVATAGILLYIIWAFRKMPNPFRWGVCAVIALGHDALVPLGLFAVLGSTRPGWEINLMFITGILTVIGYSINDTVVVFDRIRENLSRGVSQDFETVVNNSIVETLSRSLNTSLTTLLVVIALLLFVGSSIQNFAVVMLLGIVFGTYSSIGIAGSLLVVWEKREWGRLLWRRSKLNMKLAKGTD
jgi:preprotein translocase subunit SecF